MNSPSPKLRTPLFAGLATVSVAAFAFRLGLLEPGADSPTLWAKPGKDGLSCSSCHTPSGREVWSSAIRLADVKRRALNHLSEVDASRLEDEVSRLRAQHSASKGPERPFAPDHYSAANLSVKERDERFRDHLFQIAPRLTKGRVWTLADAAKASRELRATRLERVQTQILLDPLSRDPVRASDGPMLGDWIPDVGLSPAGTKAFERACAEHRRLDGNFDLPAISQAVTKVEGPPTTAIAQLALLKRMALLHWQTRLETGRNPRLVKLSATMNEDPVWAVGNFARRVKGLKPDQLGLDRATALRMGVEWDKPVDHDQSALSWMWVGWMLDPSLQTTSFDAFARNGQYLAKMFWDAGPYPWHAAYFAARRPAEARQAAHKNEAFQPEINAFVNNGVLDQLAPNDSRFVRLCANLLRMDCLLVEHDLALGRTLKFPSAAKQQLGALWTFVAPKLTATDRNKTQKIVSRFAAAVGRGVRSR